MKFVIVAAGQGSRFGSLSSCKPLTLLNDKPLLQHVIGRIASLSADDTKNEIIIVTGWHSKHIRDFVQGLNLPETLKVSTLHNNGWEKGNGTSVLIARSKIDEPFILLMADHIVEPSILQMLTMHDLSDCDLVLAVDRKLENPLVDIDDVTRVYCEDDRIVRIGKHLKTYNAFDTGCFLCAPTFFDALHTAQRQFNDYGISGGVGLLAEMGRARVADIKGARWIDVDTPEMLAKARELVIAKDI